MTYVALKSQSKRLQATLREIPAPYGVATTSYFGVDLTEPRGAVEKAEQAKASRITSTVSAAAGSLKDRARLPFRTQKRSDAPGTAKEDE